MVTVLFADLVGFTSRAERMDPEDVRALLGSYHARMRTVLERFGGTVEKFIGDAVVALFGAPRNHEDDPERAVRAALAIRDWIQEPGQTLTLRIGVNTGEGLIALEARPGEGEGMAYGDVVNTAARLQTAAPTNGILVGEATFRATSETIDYAPADAVLAKGKIQPLAAWAAVRVHRATDGKGRGIDSADSHEAASDGPSLVGRRLELATLVSSADRVRRERQPELVNVVGVPGLGKSRLIAELCRVLGERTSDRVTSLQGRSLPYGDSVTFWALSEILKAHAGIQHGDPPAVGSDKLHRAVSAAVVNHADARWIEGHLRPLVGLREGAAPESDRRAEAFTAWRRFFSALAEQQQLVLVFEDMHWADDDLLDFMEHLVDQSAGAPILIVCSARPELLERRTGWGAEEHQSTTLWLSPLSDTDTESLIHHFPAASGMSAVQQEVVLSRAGGNPLYAEQYMRMLTGHEDALDLPPPATVHGVIAARLDALQPEEKTVLQDAAVIGKVFWLGALQGIGGHDGTNLRGTLDALERKDFIERIPAATIMDDVEYAFLHVLLRDVSYGQIPRGQRAEKHRLAARWIASLSRTDEYAELRAHHYVNAIELYRATGRQVDDALSEGAVTSLSQSGDRAFSLNAYARASAFYESALHMPSSDPRQHGHLLLKLGRTRFLAGDLELDVLSSAGEELLAWREHEAAMEAETLLAEVWQRRGEREEVDSHIARAVRLAEDLPPSPAKVYVICRLAVLSMMAGEDAAAIHRAKEAATMARELELDWVRADALGIIGVCRIDRGEAGGLQDLERSVALAQAAGVPRAICQGKVNFASALWEWGQLKRSASLIEEAAEVASRFGLLGHLRFIRGEKVAYQHGLGRWHEALRGADEFIAEVEAGSPHYAASTCYSARGSIRQGADDIAGAVSDAKRAIELARISKDPQSLYPALAVGADILSEAGDVEGSGALAGELLAVMGSGAALGFAIVCVHRLAWTLTAHGRAHELLPVLPAIDTPWIDAARAFASGKLRLAADVCARMGAQAEEARVRLWLARELIRSGRTSEGDPERTKALDFYRSVGATRYIREAEAILVMPA